MTVATPTSPMALNSAGLQSLRQGDAGKAAELFEAALKLDPDAVPLWLNLATACRAQNNVAGEITALDAALDRDRLHFMAWLRKAQWHQREGEKSAALTAWRAAIQLAGDVGSMSPEVARQLDEGRAYVADVGARFAAAVDEAFDGQFPEADAQSRRRIQAFVDVVTGRRKTYQNQCAGLFYPFLPVDEFFDDHHFPWFEEVNSRTDAIRAEFEAVYADPGESLRPYVQLEKGGPEAQWATLNNSLDWGALFLWEFGTPNAPVLERCPVTADLIRSIPSTFIPGRAPNVMFSILRPGAHIPPHTGVTNTRAVVHLPLIVPNHCAFRVGGETRAWEVGKAFAFDDTIEHEAWNNSDEMRAVLIFDVWNPHLSDDEQNAILRYFMSADSLGLAER